MFIYASHISRFHFMFCVNLSCQIWFIKKNQTCKTPRFTIHQSLFLFYFIYLFIYFKDEWHVLDNEVSKLGLFWSAIQDDSLLNEYISSNVCKIFLYNSFSKRFFKGLIKVICFYSVRCLRPCYLLWTCEVVDIWWQIISKVFSQSLYCQHFRNKLMT